ncbi:nuclear transport factor 2 family protein [Rhodococcus artemisiae]|uniref:Nuclear transport factor 2 family protein n=1 Tax=Rhodococcus artemisiae TaxID=714159 RepID=A0ABU7LKU1_9NOCA|nr:nuclear transport factor 2 family protein [Rhodococcus artemisiae]MEE2062188.1 nuclear transport factor 2 family protein [Rhodococcus artemisiae]
MATITDDVTVSELAQRLSRLEDLRAIEQLKYRYAGYCDNGYDPDGIVSLFVEDGRWVVDGEGGTMTGHDEIKAHFRALSDKITWALHYMIAPRIELSDDGRSATGYFYLLCLCTIENSADSTTKDPVILTINYTDQFVKRDGAWYFQELLGKTHQVSNWDQGWVKQPFRD